MTDRSRTRRLTLVRPQPSTPEPQSDTGSEIPRASKAEIRHLIEVEGLGSPTEIANRLNFDGFPCAMAEAWTAKLVDSALRRQDMLDLKDRLKENRGPEDAQPLSKEELRQAILDGTKEAIDKLDLSEKLKLPEIPPLKVDAFTIKETVTTAVGAALKEHLRTSESAYRSSVAEIASSVRSALRAELATGVAPPDVLAVRRVTEATGRNVGDILKRIDVVCEDLHETVTQSFSSHRTDISNACENLAIQLSDQVDKRLASMTEEITNRLSTSSGLEEILVRVVDARLKQHLDSVVNQFAVMVDALRRDLKTGSIR